MGTKQVVLSGGEPTLRKDLVEIIEYAKSRGIKIGLLTNGILLNNGLLDVLEPYVLSGHISLTISLDGIKPETHDCIRGAPGSFEKTVNAIKKVAEMKKLKGSRAFIEIISIVLDKNLEELMDIIKFVHGLGVNKVQLQPLLENNLYLDRRVGNDPLWVPEERLPILDKSIDEIISYKKETPHLISNSVGGLKLMKLYFRRKLKNEDIKCYALFKTMLISNDGNYTACGTSYGNCRDVGLWQAWKSEAAAKSREKIKSCKEPCLLPCFTDAELNSLAELSMGLLKNGSVAELRNSLKILEKYEKILRARLN
jgi:MoaA/NifB/PqqE/SkfB family radical SAM enzyme